VDKHYLGVWPDDVLYPLITVPGLMTNEELSRLLEFLTDSVIGLDRLPDRVEPDGLPILAPGTYAAPHTSRMPLHVPAAWVRLLDYCELRGVAIPRKREWGRAAQRGYDLVPFSCGLVYIDPQFPCVGFGFHDGIAITGFELMCSLMHYRGLRRACRLFGDVAEPEVIERWSTMSHRIRANLPRLFDPAIGGFVAGSRDCRQFSVWGNGLAYGLADDGQQQAMMDFYRKNRDRVFLHGCARQIAEASGWQRLLTKNTLGEYMNGGAWATGTGYVLPAIARRDPAFAAELVTQFVEIVTSTRAAEWLDSTGAARGAKQFNASLALPLIGLKSILSGVPLIDFF
jgi:hypothetical protein